MKKYVIVTDSTTDLTNEYAVGNDLIVLPLGFSIGGNDYKDYLDHRDLSIEEFYKKIDSGLTSKTTQINSEEFFKVFEEFVLQDKYGMVLSDKYKVFNINIEECYNLWYHNNYQGMFEPYEEDLMLLCASLMVSDESDFKKILQMIQMKPEIKELMEGVTKQMSHDEELVTEYKTWKNENERINASIINEERNEAHQLGLEEGIQKGKEQGIKEGTLNTKREMVLKMYNKKNNIVYNFYV